MKLRAKVYLFSISLLLTTCSDAFITTNVLQNGGFEAGIGADDNLDDRTGGFFYHVELG